jgi:phytoene dehydrogenase-like protein
LAALPKLNATDYDSITVREWLAQTVRQPKVQQLVQALFRVATYTNDPERQSAGAALRQFQMALSGGVYYLDNGWQTLVSGLRAVAEQAGAIIHNGVSVTAIERSAQGFVIQFANGQTATASSVILAVNPTDAAALVKTSETLAHWARTLLPVRAACLDVALTHWPEPHARFGLGIDQPYYFSVHSATAKLAPNNGAMIHVAKYLPTDSDEEAHTIEQQLEQVLDLLQPGWRKAVVTRRFLPRMTVTNALVTTTPRPAPAVPGLEGLYVAGDWVGSEGQLVDASFASAKAAAELLAQQRHYATAIV